MCTLLFNYAYPPLYFLEIDHILIIFQAFVEVFNVYQEMEPDILTSVVENHTAKNIYCHYNEEGE